MRSDPTKTARGFIEEYFPHCEAALLSGSVVRGEHTSSSDLDIVILEKDTYRKSFVYQEWPIEAFVYNEDSLDYTFFIEKQHGVPLLTRLCAEGVIIKGGMRADALIEEGKKSLLEGPNPLPAYKLDQCRYMISDLLDDLEGSACKAEDIFTVSALIGQLHSFILRAEQKWTGEGKWMYRSLKKHNPLIARRLAECTETFYKSHQKEDIIQLADELLKPFGGRLFHDFMSRH
ncbi:nucleotidyltransferase domain-containing protein [Halobacillus massiliensis]|uniref:nucleotidyltransferase domain-containing protein n=1 Tax=Halobacillus massiliensis TaxID=1926286 RepID=UPI0015C4A49D|nr:nucleotidyltransferase domain-containing protein [Halobacillus massiliensis]